MKINEFVKFRAIENVFSEKFQLIIEEFVDQYIAEILLFPETEDEIENMKMRVNFCNNLSDKIISFHFVYDYFNKRIFFDMWVRHKETSTDQRTSFRTKDYCTYKNILLPDKFERAFLFTTDDSWENFTLLMDEYFSFMKELFQTKEMQRLVFTDYWEKIPIDYSPYY